MEGGGEGWGDEVDEEEQEQGKDQQSTDDDKGEDKQMSRDGRWESGKGRCAITGRRLLGGTGGLRRVII